MPNIEIHGCHNSDGDAIRLKILEGTRKLKIMRDSVITICGDTVIDDTGVERPFLRVYSEPQDRIVNLIKVLRSLSFEIEHIEVKAFYPRLP